MLEMYLYPFIFYQDTSVQKNNFIFHKWQTKYSILLVLKGFFFVLGLLFHHVLLKDLLS